jgi:hypothetical protein
MKPETLLLKEFWAHSPATKPYSQRFIPSLRLEPYFIEEYLWERCYHFSAWCYNDDGNGVPELCVFVLSDSIDAVAVRIMDCADERKYADPVAEAARVLSLLY